MTTNRLNPCPACGSDYEIKYYQRRAPDEPQDAVIYCPNCPLDTGKLTLDYKVDNTEINTISNDRAIKSTRDFYRKNRTSAPTTILERLESRYVIKVEGSAANRCYTAINSIGTKPVSIVECTLPVYINQNRELARFHIKSSTINEAHIVTKEQKVAPYVVLQEIDVLIQKASLPSYTVHSVSGYEYILETMEGSSLTVLRTLYQGKQPCILIYLGNKEKEKEKKEDLILSILQQILTTYGTETSIKSFISSSTISSLYMQSGKAYDWSFAPLEGYSFAWKPDGERFWYVKYGSVWLFCRRLLSGRITGWNICKTLQPTIKAGPVLDVEVMIGHDPILIDILILESGSVTDSLRSLNYVLQQYKLMTTVDIPIFVRDYFRSEKEVLDSADKINYPTDGVVGIADGSMDIIKLKDTKSIELKLLENGNLLSADDKLVMTSALQDTYMPGSIVEIRFSKQSATDTLSITETLLRTDKTKANSYEVCQDIINTISDMPDTLARRKSLIWCNTVRQTIHQRAANTKGKGRVIIDIGSGDGQAISDYSSNPEVTYLLIEPNLQKCKKLLKRIGESGISKCRLYETTDNILKVVSLLSNGSLKYAIVNSTIENVIAQDQCIKVLKTCARYCVASFSISYISSTLSRIALSGIDIIGCGYMYDTADSSGTLINECGVQMKIINSSNTAKVLWGSDKEYKEPVITTESFKDAFHIQLASNLVPVLTSTDTPLLTAISSKVHIISTKKYV